VRVKNEEKNTKKARKFIYGSILILVYFCFFIWQSEARLGVLPLVVISIGWGWLFYKATGININNLDPFTRNTNKSKE
jgi:hypothetical protein